MSYKWKLITCASVTVVCGCLLASTGQDNHDQKAVNIECLTGVEGDGRITWVIRTTDGYVCDVVDSGRHMGRIVAIGQSGKKRTLLKLGWDSPLAKEKGIEVSEPYLVAQPSKDILVLNLVCPPSLSQDTKRDADTATGNVLLLHMSSGELVNLTRLAGSDDSFAEAVAFVPDEDILIVAKSKLVENANYPTPSSGTNTPLYLNLKGEAVSPDKCPRAAAVYAEYASLLPISAKCDGKSAWRISLGDDAFLVGMDILKKPSVRFIGKGVWAIVGKEVGTYLIRPGDSLVSKVSRDEAVGCDASDEMNLIFRRTTKNESPTFYSTTIGNALGALGRELGTDQPSNTR